CTGLPRALHPFPTRRSSDLCLESALLPMITATVRLTWSGGRLTATVVDEDRGLGQCAALALEKVSWLAPPTATLDVIVTARRSRSEEHTSELQSPDHLVCRL